MNYLRYLKTIIDYLTDALNFFSKLTLFKIFNILKVRLSYRISTIGKIPVVWGLPYTYSIEPTSLCNLQCPECPTGIGEILREKTNIDHDLYIKILDQIKNHASYLMLYLQGEPFLSSKIFEMLQLANTYKIYSCISTNGHFLTDQNARKTVESGLDRIIISLDGATPDVYRIYRKRGSFHEVVAGIRRLVETKEKMHSQTPYIILQFIVFKHNQHQIEEIKNLGNQLGVNLITIKTAQLYNYTNGHSMLTDLTKLARYKKVNDKIIFKNKLSNSCQRIWSTGVITTDGMMTSCCYDKHSNFIMGNAKNDPIKKIWSSDKFINHRLNILTDRKKIKMCTNCGEK